MRDLARLCDSNVLAVPTYACRRSRRLAASRRPKALPTELAARITLVAPSLLRSASIRSIATVRSSVHRLRPARCGARNRLCAPLMTAVILPPAGTWLAWQSGPHVPARYRAEGIKVVIVLLAVWAAPSRPDAVAQSVKVRWSRHAAAGPPAAGLHFQDPARGQARRRRAGCQETLASPAPVVTPSPGKGPHGPAVRVFPPRLSRAATAATASAAARSRGGTAAGAWPSPSGRSLR